jgi:predicted transcriptional regulator
MSNINNDRDFVIKALMNTGMSRNTAKVFTYIAMNKGTTSEKIEREMCLRQPDVSVSVQDLYSRGWLNRVSIKGTGKGRPKYLYTLSKPFKDIVSEIERTEKEKIKEIESNIKDMKSSELFAKS